MAHGEDFGQAELQAVYAALLAFEQRCEGIMTTLGEKRCLTPSEREHVAGLYAALKTDLKAAAKTGTLSGRRGPQTRVETCFYDPAVRRAAIALRPATNSHPISSGWFSAVYEAQSEFSYYRHSLQSCLQHD